jgi:Restriction Endonuclease associating with ARP
MERKMATWEQVQRNPTLYPQALLPGEGERLRWHDDANRPHSSQVFCVSAIGTLRHLPARDQVIGQLVGLDTPTAHESVWDIELEAERPDLLSEYGRVQPSSVDALLQNERAVCCLESKFLSDAVAGFGGCSQPKQQCAGYYGPGSDLKTRTPAWCRLEVWDGERSPRTYWTLGRAFFRESVFAKQANGETCPFAGPNYQLMRNFLFAAALAQQKRLESFGVVAIAPARKSGRLERQVESFRTTILQPQFAPCVRIVTYERLIELLRQCGDHDAAALATFLVERIAALVP